jgi:two-component sensor histidine kinase
VQDADTKGRIGSPFARLSTGLKMLIIITLGLLPLLLVAIFASVDSARQREVDRRAETMASLEIKAQALNAVLSRSEIVIGTAGAAIALADAPSTLCAAMLRRLESGPITARYALYGPDGGPACASRGFAPPPPIRAAAPGLRAEIAPDGQRLRLTIFGESGAPQGLAEYDRPVLAALADVDGPNRDYDLALGEGGRQMILRQGYAGGFLRHVVQGSRAIADGRIALSIRSSALPVTAADLAMISLPVLMWIFGALIGWGILSRLLLLPLKRMQRAIAAYRPGDTSLALPRLRTPAREIVALGDAFEETVRTVARHEADMAAAVERQTRLVREVHHRVKNNLQVVASLLNLHSRGSPNEQVAAAYASIQRRVDALAVVHRNHYAELEENRGVALKPLLSELAANLRATAPASASAMQIRLDLEPFYATQDVAVSVAFLVTEVVEYAMFCDAASVAISLTGEAKGAVAAMTIESDSLRADVDCDPVLYERFERIVTGLSRQLRSTIERDSARGRYALTIAVVDKAERG